MGVAAPEAEDEAMGEAGPDPQAVHKVPKVPKVQMSTVNAGIREITNPS